MPKRKSLNLESFLESEDIERFHTQWEKFTGKNELSVPYDVHNGKPVISKVFQFEDKSIFRARVFQGRKHLRQINPYNNAPYYQIPFWHYIHLMIVGEQLYHGMMELHRPNNYRYIVTEIPELSLKEKIFWPGRVNGHVSAIGKYKTVMGSLEKGKLSEKYYCLIYDDEERKEKGSFSTTNFIGFRSFFKTTNDLVEKKLGSKERMIRLIETQEREHNYLLQPRTDLTSSGEELIEKVESGGIPSEEELINFFSLYDRIPESQPLPIDLNIRNTY